jgi:uncharacterized protein YutE (UPF0331/DUF86 family)
MVRFRNLIVHTYAKIDYQQVFDIMQNGPKVIESYIDAVGTFCKL